MDVFVLADVFLVVVVVVVVLFLVAVNVVVVVVVVVVVLVTIRILVAISTRITSRRKTITAIVLFQLPCVVCDVSAVT